MFEYEDEDQRRAIARIERLGRLPHFDAAAKEAGAKAAAAKLSWAKLRENVEILGRRRETLDGYLREMEDAGDTGEVYERLLVRWAERSLELLASEMQRGRTTDQDYVLGEEKNDARPCAKRMPTQADHTLLITEFLARRKGNPVTGPQSALEKALDADLPDGLTGPTAVKAAKRILNCWGVDTDGMRAEDLCEALYSRRDQIRSEIEERDNGR